MKVKIAAKLERSSDSYKGENGRVLVIGGSMDYTGAPALSANAALRTGSDLVKIYCPEAVADIIAGYSENFIVERYSSDYLDLNAARAAMELSEWADSIVLGPGLGEVDQKPVREILNHAKAPLVVDADALEYVPRSSVKDAVLTPHSGEMKELMEGIQNLNIMLNRNIAVVEKGSTDKVHTSEKTRKFDVGCPAMTVGGTGDSLAGIAASLLSQDLDIDEAAELAAKINGKAGELAAEEKGNGMLATDLIEKIPEIIRTSNSFSSPT